MADDPSPYDTLTTRRHIRETYPPVLEEHGVVHLDVEFSSRAAADELVTLAINHDACIDVTACDEAAAKMFELIADERIEIVDEADR